MLLGREDLRDRVLRLAGSSRLYMTTQALDDAARRVSRYLLMQLAVNAMYGALVGVRLLLIGVPNPLVWAVEANAENMWAQVKAWIEKFVERANREATEQTFRFNEGNSTHFTVVSLFPAPASAISFLISLTHRWQANIERVS